MLTPALLEGLGGVDIGFLDLEVMLPWPNALSPALLGPFSAHLSSACFTSLGYPEQHPTIPALLMYLYKKIRQIVRVNLIFGCHSKLFRAVHH
jgi:hypothetical protein